MIRIVKLTFQPDGVVPFLQLFEEKKHLIHAFPGCRSVVLCRDLQQPSVFFTISEWDSPNNLEDYRASSLFRETWALTKIWFAQAPETFSMDLISEP